MQVIAFVPPQAPEVQTSALVQALLSLHTVPSTAFGLEHTPVVTSQVPALWHWSRAEHTTGFAPVHVPFWQVSVCVHALASLHVVPFVLFGFEHMPVVTWHTPGS